MDELSIRRQQHDGLGEGIESRRKMRLPFDQIIDHRRLGSICARSSVRLRLMSGSGALSSSGRRRSSSACAARTPGSIEDMKQDMEVEVLFEATMGNHKVPVFKPRAK